MRNILTICCAGSAIVIGGLTAGRADASVSTFARMMQAAMASMDTAMMRVAATGDPDVDFARMMIPHHEGAVRMAEIELTYGHDKRLRRLASEIIITQQSEIAAMRLALHPH